MGEASYHLLEVVHDFISLRFLAMLRVVLIPSWTTFSSALGYYGASCGAYTLFEHSLFSIGLLAVLHVVLVPSLTTPFSALGYWQCFMWCLYPHWPLPFQCWVSGSASCGAYPSLTSPVQPWVDSRASFGLVRFDVNEKLNKNTVLECTSKQCTCKIASKCMCSMFIYYHFSTLL